MVKRSVPVTIDDLKAAAKDDKNGLACYRFVEVQWYQSKFHYFYKGERTSKEIVVAILKGYK